MQTHHIVLDTVDFGVELLSLLQLVLNAMNPVGQLLDIPGR